MIGRVLAAVAMGLTLVVVGAVAVRLELARASGRIVYVPVQSAHYELGWAELRLDPDADPSTGRSWIEEDDAPRVYRLKLDRDSRVWEGEGRSSEEVEQAEGFVDVRLVDRRYVPTSWPLAESEIDRVAYLRIRVSDDGTAFASGVTDAELRLLGRGDPAW